jgi:hypothetical protein
MDLKNFDVAGKIGVRGVWGKMVVLAIPAYHPFGEIDNREHI